MTTTATNEHTEARETVARAVQKRSPMETVHLAIEAEDAVNDAGHALRAIQAMLLRVAEAEVDMSDSEVYAMLNIAVDGVDQVERAVAWLEQAQRQEWAGEGRTAKLPAFNGSLDGDEAVAALRLIADLPPEARRWIVTGERHDDDKLLDPGNLMSALSSSLNEMRSEGAPLLAFAQAACMVAQAMPKPGNKQKPNGKAKARK